MLTFVSKGASEGLTWETVRVRPQSAKGGILAVLTAPHPSTSVCLGWFTGSRYCPSPGAFLHLVTLPCSCLSLWEERPSTGEQRQAVEQEQVCWRSGRPQLNAALFSTCVDVLNGDH